MTPPNKPRWNQIFINRHIWVPEYDQFVLPPYGYLLAVGVTHADSSLDEFLFYNPDRSSDYRGTFHISSLGAQPDDPPIAVFNWPYELNQCGVAFDPPRVDMNTTVAHVVRRVIPTRTMATLLITSVHLGF
jgi:hypothetical protein